MFDLEPATRVLTGLVDGVRDDQLAAPTPCAESCLGDLLDHLDGLSVAFTAAATKTSPVGGSQGLLLMPHCWVRTGARGSRSACRCWRERGAMRLRGPG